MEDSTVDEKINEFIAPELFYQLQKYGFEWNWTQFAEFLTTIL